MAFLGPSFRNLILAFTFKGWAEFFRLVRGEILAEKKQEYVGAARVIGQPHWRIIGRELLPNIMHSVIVLGTLRLGHMIMMEASLSFLGLGIQPPTLAWGSMVATGRDYLFQCLVDFDHTGHGDPGAGVGDQPVRRRVAQYL